MAMRRSHLFIGSVLLWVILFIAMAVHSHIETRADARLVAANRALVREFGLTDLCLFTDARYTRHPVMADLSTAFQDYPMSFEHFPSGSLMGPPPHLDGRVGR